MWIFFTDAFLSIVDKDGDGSTLLVRARRAGEIERIFPEASVTMGAGTDYAYRARLPRERVAEAVAEAVRDIDYPNFKSEVEQPDRHDAYMNVWSVMFDYQRGE